MARASPANLHFPGRRAMHPSCVPWVDSLPMKDPYGLRTCAHVVALSCVRVHLFGDVSYRAVQGRVLSQRGAAGSTQILGFLLHFLSAAATLRALVSREVLDHGPIGLQGGAVGCTINDFTSRRVPNAAGPRFSGVVSRALTFAYLGFSKRRKNKTR